MGREEVIRSYLHAMENGDLAATLACFVLGATVKSPVYGSMPVEPFYERLYGDTTSAKVDIINIYGSVANENAWAAHFDYKWTRKDGQSLASSLVDLFTFDGVSGKIEHLEIIFDRGAMK